jgi:hypothetical protein
LNAFHFTRTLNLPTTSQVRGMHVPLRMVCSKYRGPQEDQLPQEQK